MREIVSDALERARNVATERVGGKRLRRRRRREDVRRIVLAVARELPGSMSVADLRAALAGEDGGRE
jgi:hypothetical protein